MAGRIKGVAQHDAESGEVGESALAGQAWAGVRASYSDEVRAKVDAVAEAGGLSLHDIELLEYAEHETLAARIDDLLRAMAEGEKTGTAVTALYSVRLQSRKHLRTLRIAMTPIGTPNDNRHPTSEEQAKKDAALAAVAEGADPNDTGDELVN
jgi:hypothetical protein